MEPKDVERWLASEARGDEQEAESAFSHLVASVPRIEPLPGFGARAQAAAWRSRRRRRVIAGAGSVAALLLAVSGGVAASWAALLYAGPWVLVSGAAMVSGSLVGIAGGVVAGLEWWAAGARVAAVVGETFAYREMAGALLAVEVVGAVALYALHQLTRSTGTNGA